MTLLSVERIKLFSTKSPYWCLASIVAAALLFALLMGTVEGGKNASTFLSQAGMQIGMSVFMVLSALAITTEYRFGTIRASFLAVPQRPSVLVAKTIVLVVLGVVVALISSFAAFFLTKVLAGSAPSTPLTLSTGDDWRIVLGHSALFGIAAIAAVAVGSMVRQSAGAITILLVWPLLIENLIALIPSAGPKIQLWMPFHAGSAFVSAPPDSTVFGEVVQQTGPTPVQGLLVFAGTAVILWAIALILMKRRDA